ncbi:MAG: GNAT family N-acetyltransferase, partial [Spirochaetales bacterium]|nr:GNAT family N-acetyltransferase [Spirochaetales bacterium]
RSFPAAASNMEQSMAGRIHTPLVLPEDASPWSAAYPAHLHIDLLPPLQGKGWGRALIETLLGELRNRGCPGIHLEVSADNTAAIAFYTKMGFSVLRTAPQGLVMGKRITDAPA